MTHAIGTLAVLPERALTRPLVLVLVNGYRFAGGSLAASEGVAAASMPAAFPAVPARSGRKRPSL